MRIRTVSTALSALFLLLVFVASAAGGEEQGQPYEKINYPSFKEGRIDSLLVADQAEAYDLAAGTPRINLRNVEITLYENTAETRAATPEDRPLPVKVVITSDRGYFVRRPPEPGQPPEEVVNLEGNVVMRQMRLENGKRDRTRDGAVRPSKMAEGVETEIRCEHAQWNETQRKLHGDGEVRFINEDSDITGTGFLYLPDDNALDTGSSKSEIRDWGGIVFIEHNARMEIRPAGDVKFSASEAQDGSEVTIITCKDTASYKLREREIQFESEVGVRRERETVDARGARIRHRDLLIECDILKVFLRREDDPLPEGQADDPDAPVPGQVRNIVATIGRRRGSVTVTGFRTDPATGAESTQYVAKGGRADFDYDANSITLTDTRDQHWPDVEFGVDRDRITDGKLVFVFKQVQSPGGGSDAKTETVLDSLTTSGGRGEMVFRGRRSDDVGPPVTTVVKYQGDMSYDRVEGRVRFHERVRLRRGDLAISSELLDIRLSSDGVSVEPNQVNRIVAETDVELESETYKARAHRAEYDVYTGSLGAAGTGLDTLRLFAPPGSTASNPHIRDIEGNQITAPEIHMQRLTTEAGQRDQHLMVARGGTSVCDFVTGTTMVNNVVRPRVVSIKCERGMEYNQASRKARFEGSVMATSDAPEDNYVLTSDKLLVDFDEAPDPEKPGEYITWFRRITAEGNARLIQDTRVCEATNIIRDFPTPNPREGDIYLQGTVARDGTPPQLAVLREEDSQKNIGAMFVAPLIKSTSAGDLIQANGPGQLSMPPDNLPKEMQDAVDAGIVDPRNLRSEIHFEGAASYEALQDRRVSDARFWGGVVLRQPSRRVHITAEEMDARFVQDGRPSAVGGTELELENIGKLRRVEGRNNVRIENIHTNGGRRIAVGDTGVVEFTPLGNILRLSVDRAADSRRFVVVRDHDGKTLRSPEVEIREAQGITRASGPGDLQIPADPAADAANKVPTRILYGENGAMVYNELALNIKVTDNVRVVQPGPGDNWRHPSLDGVCERMEIILLEAPEAGMAGAETMARIRRMDAIGSVLLRIYADAPPENPNMDWLSRPGTTFFTRGDQATYDVPNGQISIYSLDPRKQPQLLLNMVEPGNPPRRQRLKADRFVLQTNSRPRRWNFEGELESKTIREGEPFDFIE